MENLIDKFNTPIETPDTFTNKVNASFNTLSNDIVNKINANKFTPDDIQPSQYLPKRTAKFWSEIIMGRLPMINFFKKVNDVNEVHLNATRTWEKVVDKAAMLDLLRETEYELSLKGESDIALFKQGNKVVPLKISLINKKYNPDGSLRYYHGLVNLDQGTAPWIITKKFYYNDKGEVILENAPYILKHSEEGSEWVNVSVKTFNKKFKQEINKEYNFGKINFPVFTFTNTGNDRWGSGMSDTVEVQDILQRLDSVEQAIDAAIATSKTRVLKRKVNGSMDLGNLGTIDPEIQQLDASTDVIELTVDPHNPDGTLQISDRALNADQWYNVKDKLLNQYYSYTGENVAADAHGNNQHTFEVQSKGDNKYRKGTAKKNQRKQEIISLIEGIISFYKSLGNKGFVGLDTISVNIDEVDIRKEYEIEDKVEKLMGLGLISKIQALGMIMNIDEVTAELIITNKMKHDNIVEEQEPTPQPTPQPTQEPIEGQEPELGDNIEEKE